VDNTVVMWLHILVGPYWCMFVAQFGSSKQNNEPPDDGVTAPKHVGAVLL